MAGKDNRLEAPAQGFGQNVSFAAQPGNPVVLDGIGRAGQTRGGVVGGPGMGSGINLHAVKAPANPTLDLLTKVAGTYLQSRIKEEKAAAFVSGMQRAASGEALKDIAEEQPWYSRIFGESDVVEGARQYTAQARAAEAAGAIEDSMGEVRKMDPAAAQAYYGQLVSRHLTGDDVADAALLQGFARTLPATMRRQAKEHYAWRQEEASNAESAAIMSLSGLLQKRASGNDKQTDDEYAGLAVQLAAAARPPEGRDMDSWIKARTGNLLALAQAGQFHAVNVWRSAGLLGMLPSEQRAKVESALDTSENRIIANKSFEWADEIGAIAGQAKVNHAGLSPEHSMAQMQAINERFRKATGIDRDLITLNKASGVIEDVHTTLLRDGQAQVKEASAAATKAATDAAAAAALKEGVRGVILKGMAGEGKNDPEVGKHVDPAFLAEWRALGGNPAEQAKLLANNWAADSGKLGYVNSDVRATFERGLDVAIGQQMPGNFKELSAAYEALYARSPMAADAYFGKHADRMAAYHQMLVKTDPRTGQALPFGSRSEPEAFAYAFATEPPKKRTLSKDDHKDLTKELAAMNDNPAWKVWATQGIPMRQDQLAQVSTLLAPRVAKYKDLSGGDMSLAVQRAWAEAQRETGADMIGGFFVAGKPGQKPLLAKLQERKSGEPSAGTGTDGKDFWGAALRDDLEAAAKERGLDAGAHTSIHRFDGPNGDTHLQVLFAPRDGGMPVLVHRSLDDIKARAHKARADKAAAKAAVATLQSRDNPDFGAMLAGQ